MKQFCFLCRIFLLSHRAVVEGSFEVEQLLSKRRRLTVLTAANGEATRRSRRDQAHRGKRRNRSSRAQECVAYRCPGKCGVRWQGGKCAEVSSVHEKRFVGGSELSGCQEARY